MNVIYLDNNATTKPGPEVVEAMLPYLTEWYGNASSLHRFGQRAHIFVARVGTALEQRARLGSRRHRQRSARARAVCQLLRRTRSSRMRSIDETRDVPDHDVRQMHAAHQLRELRELAPIEHAVYSGVLADLAVGDDPLQRSYIAAQHLQLEEEAIELRLGQRIGPLQLDRVLRRQHEERIRERVRLSHDGDGPLLHRFEER